MPLANLKFLPAAKPSQCTHLSKWCGRHICPLGVATGVSIVATINQDIVQCHRRIRKCDVPIPGLLVYPRVCAACHRPVSDMRRLECLPVRRTVDKPVSATSRWYVCNCDLPTSHLWPQCSRYVPPTCLRVRCVVNTSVHSGATGTSERATRHRHVSLCELPLA